jgi:hypothetical protein
MQISWRSLAMLEEAEQTLFGLERLVDSGVPDPDQAAPLR